MKIDRKLAQEGLYNTEESKEKYIINELSGLSLGLESMSLKFSNGFIILNFSL